MMLSTTAWPLVCFVVTLSAVIASASPIDAAECLALGFDASVARCSHCSLLLQHTNDPTLYDECKQCCTTTGDDDSAASATSSKLVTYHRGRIELDMRGLYPGSELARFVNEHASNFDGLTVQNVPRMQPRIVLLDDEGNAAETTRVQSWRCDLIVEYLQKKLVPAPAAAKKSGFW